MLEPRFIIGMKRHVLLPIEVIEIVNLEQRNLSEAEKASLISIAVTIIEIAEMFKGKPDEEYEPENSSTTSKVSVALKFENMQDMNSFSDLVKTILSI